MRVVLINGCVDFVIRMKPNGKPVWERRHFRGVTIAGNTDEEIINNFSYSKTTLDKDKRTELRKKEKERRIKLVFFSVEYVCGLWGIPPGHSVVEKPKAVSLKN